MGKDTKEPLKHHFGIFADGGGAFDLPQANQPESADQIATDERHCVSEERGSPSLANLLAWIFRARTCRLPWHLRRAAVRARFVAGKK